MTIEASNLTNSEYYKLNGTLSAERIEALLIVDIVDIVHISEAMQPFSAEDFI